MPGKMPEKKSFGRLGPPPGYPRSRDLYADPQNWRYPVHTPFHARAARRYFDQWSNRRKYDEEERAYIDWKIDEALKRFGLPPHGEGAPRIREAPSATEGKKPGQMSLEELLLAFLGKGRLERARKIDDSLLSVKVESDDRITAAVKEYVADVDVKKKTIVHNCEDWRKNLDAKLMCKHMGKLFLSVSPKRATNILRGILAEKEAWTFGTP